MVKTSSPKNPRPVLGFLGGGNMAEALIRGLSASREFSLQVSDKIKDRLGHLSSHYRVATTDDNLELVKSSQVIILAVKPPVVPAVLSEIKTVLRDKLLISIAAGIPVNRLKSVLGKNARVIRVMPNNPAMVGAGVTAVYADPSARREDLELTAGIFRTVGLTAFIESEELMNAVTGLSGSGPAFIYIVAEALSDAGVKLGLSRPLSDLLSFRTILGAARMLEETHKHPAELKNQVTSPGGTTIAGIEVLEARGLRSALIEAVAAAARRSQELETAGEKTVKIKS